ncbi:MAG TPA: LamG-like jellyroll fold domain-containing protein [Opitutaceae bacterium]|nr:LamG-like jellyroll fold domain-containing protein [Opitutaceae bacterium]
MRSSLSPTLLSLLLLAPLAGPAPAAAPAPEPGLLFYLSGDRGTTADFSAAGTPKPTYDSEITPIADGARGGALQCADTQVLAYRAPGNIYAQRGTLSLFWRSRYAVGPTAFPIFRVGYADHSSWDMVFLRLDYNGHGFDAFVTDASLARTRVSVPLDPFPDPKTWTHLALAWDETRGIRFFVNGKLAAHIETTARFDAALDQFGPHSRVISPHQVQSDYNFVRGGDIDEVRIYDRMLDDASIAALAKNESTATPIAQAARSLDDPATRAEWNFRYGFNHPPPALPDGQFVSIRKVEITDAYDLKRWWWKANDGIRETTWPGVYNRSRLPGRNDYFQLPDWDCYVDSGKAVTFALPDEPANHLEISGAAFGKMELLPPNTPLETASDARAESTLFERPRGEEKTVHALAKPLRNRQIRFTNVEQEQPIGELGAYNVTSGREPANATKLALHLTKTLVLDDPSVAPLLKFIDGRFAPDERAVIGASRLDPREVGAPVFNGNKPDGKFLPIVHILIPDDWDKNSDGLDGIALDLPALAVKPTHGDRIALNIQVKDPLWPLRNMLDFTFSVKPGETKTLWLDLRDRILPVGKGLYLTVVGAGSDFGWSSLDGAELRLVFKPREAARAEHELDRFTQVRDVYAMSTEEHPHDPRLDMWNRLRGDLEDLLRVNPDHVLGRQYAAVLNLNAKRPDFALAPAPAGVPLWAARQAELLGWVKKFVLYYIDHRQSAFGDFGGGISDDVDLLNTWPGVALMGVEPEKLSVSLRRLLDAAYRNGMFTRGLPTIQVDELHSYEEGINCLAQNLILDFGNPTELERAMETARGIETITGINAAGHRHIMTSYYNGTKMALDAPWGVAKPYSHLVLQVPQLLVDYNGNPAAKKYLVEIADGLLAHRHAGAGGRGSLPAAIEFATDRELSASRGYFPWHVFWGPWKWTDDKKYLTPILDGGPASALTVNANTLDLLGLRATLAQPAATAEAAPDAPARGARGRGRGFGANNEHTQWQLTGDKSRLEALYAAQIETCALLHYINTDGSLWIDRVSVPYTELQRARLGGVALARNSLYPGHTVSWSFAAPASDQSVALLIPDATTTSFKVIAYNLETTPVRATMTGWNIDPGQWEITQGIDANNDDVADQPGAARTEKFERSRSLDFTFAPRATTILTFKLKTPGTPYWSRPDLGLDANDVALRGNALHVRVHSLGSVAAPASSLALRNAAGKVVATAAVPALDAPNDLLPKTAEVTLPLPAGFSSTGATVELDPDHQLEEITTRNNVVKL